MHQWGAFREKARGLSAPTIASLQQAGEETMHLPGAFHLGNYRHVEREKPRVQFLFGGTREKRRKV